MFQSCIIQMEEIYDTPDAIHIVLEWMKGGELFERIRNRGSLTESCAKLIFYQVVLAVHYLHKEGITHRDLKVLYRTLFLICYRYQFYYMTDNFTAREYIIGDSLRYYFGQSIRFWFVEISRHTHYDENLLWYTYVRCT